MIDSRNVARAGAWFVLVLTLVSSVQHVAAMFAAGDRWGGWVPAVAIDGGLLVTTYSLTKQRNLGLLVGFWSFLALSVYANLDHALEAAMGMPVRWQAIWLLDPWQLLKVGATASPPLLAAMMTEVAVKLSHGPEVDAPVVRRRQPQQLSGRQPAQLPQVRVDRLTVDKKRQQRAKQLTRRQPQPVAKLPVSTAATTGAVNQVDDNPEPSTSKVVAQPGELPAELLQAVGAYRRYGNLREAGRYLNISGEAVRKRLARARDIAPEWVADQIGE